MADLFQEHKTCARVLVPYPVDKAYTYAVPDEMAVTMGDLVRVPLGPREVIGVVWAIDADDKPNAKTKPIIRALSMPPLPDVMIAFVNWVSAYTMNPKGMVLKMVLSGFEGKIAKTVKTYSLTNAPPLTPPPAGKNLRPPPRERGDKGGSVFQSTNPITKRARDLRNTPTEAEKKLWSKIKSEQLNVKFRRQYPIGPYFADFACLEKKLIIEVDGGQHNEDTDRDRTEFIESEGFRVIRFWNNEVLKNIEGVVHEIETALTLPPLPPRQRGGIRKSVPPIKSPLVNGGARGGEKLTPKQQSVINILEKTSPLTAAALAKKADVGTGVIKTLVKKGVIEETETQEPPPCTAPDPSYGAFDLSKDQGAVAARLKANTDFKVTLLDGVTGAGKTEVYFEAVAQALKNNKQILILLPEIALSNTFLERFKRRFGCAPALWHSNLTKSQRAKTWRGVVTGQTRVIIGARSALFLPYTDLGLIVVDEEHDPAYKQEEQGLYHARDMAVIRAHMTDCPIILVSATPSLETMHNVWQGKYAHEQLPARFGGASMPQIHLIDMREDKTDAQHFISPTLQSAVEATLGQGKQALFFLNRRGYAPLTICRHCGHRMECPRCTAWLVEHKFGTKLQCHHCGFDTKTPEVCPECEEKDTLAACGPGVERIRDEAQKLFPDARIVVLASDILDGQDDLRNTLERIKDGSYDIIIGTQIIAKGHHFPLLTCVGVIDADLGLSGGELHASERVYQLLNQVAGRAGREQDQGHVYLQTFMPDHKIMQSIMSGDRDTFLKTELAERQMVQMPPYTRLVGIIVQGKDEQQVIDTAKRLGQHAPQNDRIQTLGPAPAPMARLRGNYRYRLLVRADKAIKIQTTIAAWVNGIKKPSAVRVIVDIDPQSFV